MEPREPFEGTYDFLLYEILILFSCINTHSDLNLFCSRMFPPLPLSTSDVYEGNRPTSASEVGTTGISWTTESFVTV